MLKPLPIAGKIILKASLVSSLLCISAAGRWQNPSAPPPPAAAAEAKVGEAQPTVDQVLEKYVQALGGKAAVQAPTSRVMKGTLTAPAFGVKGTIEIYAKAPNKRLIETAAPMLGRSRVGFNGTTAWQEEDGTVKELAAFAKRDADFYLPAKLQQIYPKIEFKGKEKIGIHQTYHLEAPRGGTPKLWYFDADSGLLLRTEIRSSEGKLLNREDYEDYRAVDGIKIPFTTRQVYEDGTELVINLNTVTHNVPIDEAKFEKPAAKSGTDSK